MPENSRPSWEEYFLKIDGYSLDMHTGAEGDEVQEVEVLPFFNVVDVECEEVGLIEFKMVLHDLGTSDLSLNSIPTSCSFQFAENVVAVDRLPVGATTILSHGSSPSAHNRFLLKGGNGARLPIDLGGDVTGKPGHLLQEFWM